MRISFPRVLFTFTLLNFVLIAQAVHAKDNLIGFDGLPEFATNVGDFGVTITGASVLTCGGTLNCGPFPPFSGKNVIYDNPSNGGTILASFDKKTVGRVDKVSARITGNTNISMEAYTSDNILISSVSTGGANYVGSGTGIPANKLLLIELTDSDKDKSIAKVIFHDHGNTFTIDDLYFRSNNLSIAIDAGHGAIIKNGTPQYQRSPSPTYGVIEDVVVLEISNSIKSNLENDGYDVIMTRTGNNAPFAPPNCNVPCLIDTSKRAQWAKKQEVDMLVSVHTNGGVPTANGTETFYSGQAKIGSSKLAQNILNQQVGLGLKLRGGGAQNSAKSNVITVPNYISALTEIAFHSNSELATGQIVTDEERLADIGFRSSAANAISVGIKNTIKDLGY